jgi:hypothetical protein
MLGSPFENLAGKAMILLSFSTRQVAGFNRVEYSA